MMRWLVLALLLIASPAQAAVLWFAGIETGDKNEFTNQAGGSGANSAASVAQQTTGAYSLNTQAAAAGGYVEATYSATGTVFLRVRFRAATIGPGTGNTVLSLRDPGVANMNLCLDLTTAKFFWGSGACSGLSKLAEATNAITTNTWYLLEVKVVFSLTVGGMELKQNGVQEFSSFVTNVGSTTSSLVLLGHDQGTGAPINAFYDDAMVCSSAYCPSGGTIARQGVAGSPTYTAWVKTGTCSATGIETCWSTTPFGTGAAATSIVASDAQTMNVASFGTTQTGHGTETIAVHDTINACKTAWIAKTASASAASIRRRLNGTDTDTAKTLTTSDAYYDDGIWTTTTDILRDATKMEIGAVHGTGINLDTVEDMWLMCDYAAVTVPVRHRVTQ